MSVLDRKELEQSPLADLHAIASELGVEGYRRLRKEDLIGAILEGQGDGGGEPASEEITAPARPPRRSERYPSLVRVDAVNGQPPEPPAKRPRFDDLPPMFA